VKDWEIIEDNLSNKRAVRSCLDHLPSGNQKRFWLDPALR
jgi:hypothetical protein